MTQTWIFFARFFFSAFAADFATASMGAAGRIILPLCIAASAFGSGNGEIGKRLMGTPAIIWLPLGTLFTAARLVRQSALQGDFPMFLASLWGRKGNKAPVPALLSQCEGLEGGVSISWLLFLHIFSTLPDIIAVLMIISGSFADLVGMSGQSMSFRISSSLPTAGRLL